MQRVLVTGATGTIGREVVAQLSAAGRHVRAMTRDPHAAHLPQGVEVVRGDLSAPDTLDACLRDVDAVFLVWQLPLAPASAAVQRIASHAKLTQREQVEIIGDAIGRRLQYEELPPAAARQYLSAMTSPSVADMLLTAYAAATDRPALVTATVAAVTGEPARSFTRWAADHAAEFVTPS